jgi:hypothetical protein
MTPTEDADLVKFDCEGSESFALGCCPSAVLRRIRFIVGEYHGLQRFVNVMTSKLFETHRVCLFHGTNGLGSFFAERHDEEGVLAESLEPLRWLRPDKPPRLPESIVCHAFKGQFVPERLRRWCPVAGELVLPE